MTPSIVYRTPDVYSDMFNQAEVTRAKVFEVDRMVNGILANKRRYQAVSDAFSNDQPWWFLAIIHLMEKGGDFRHHPHNGDPLTARTVNVPAGRPTAPPKAGAGHPYSWEESAFDYIKFCGYDNIKDWSIGNVLMICEMNNGGGYIRRGINSPYIWSFTQFYGSGKNVGKYRRDRVFDPNLISRQPGCAALLKRMELRGLL